MKVLTISGHQIEESIDSRGVQESESMSMGTTMVFIILFSLIRARVMTPASELASSQVR